MSGLEIFPDAAALAQFAAGRFVAASEEAVAARGRFTVALSGGSTPRGTYLQLASPEFATRISWRNVEVFWGDERCVPPDHPESNYHMAQKSVLQKVPIPQANVHRIQGELAPDQAAEAYEEELRNAFGSEEVARFDLIYLGLGADGHTASLFAGSSALRETRRWVAANFVDKLKAWRVTLTPPVLNAARELVFLVSGSAKAERLQQVLEGDRQPEMLPAQIVEPKRGQVDWLVDQAAAASLNQARSEYGKLAKA